MSWAGRYRGQAEAWRRAANAWANAGKEGRAREALVIARMYDRLAAAEEKRS